jgi:L-phenylalanine/L-methionine N-acetyltransferase
VETLPDRALSASGGQAGFVVRPARGRDARSFLEMWRTVVDEKRYVRSETVGRSVRYYRRHYFRRSWTNEQASLVAVHGERVIGHLNVAREEGPMTGHVASLGMAVAPDWRGKGVGSALLAEAIRWAKEMGVEKLALSVYPHNEAALALYRRYGFREEGRLTGHSKKSIGYLDEIVMGLWVNVAPSSNDVVT